MIIYDKAFYCLVAVSGNLLLAATPSIPPESSAAGSGSSLVEAPDSRMNALAASGKVIQLTNLRKEFTSSIDKTATRVAVDGVDLTMYEVRPGMFGIRCM